jgi:hypothetical protein
LFTTESAEKLKKSQRRMLVNFAFISQPLVLLWSKFLWVTLLPQIHLAGGSTGTG